MSETTELVRQLVAINSINPDLVPGGAGEGEIARSVARQAQAVLGRELGSDRGHEMDGLSAPERGRYSNRHLWPGRDRRPCRGGVVRPGAGRASHRSVDQGCQRVLYQAGMR
jgi:hypothetical protein